MAVSKTLILSLLPLLKNSLISLSNIDWVDQIIVIPTISSSQSKLYIEMQMIT
jgi:hypothetical protein